MEQTLRYLTDEQGEPTEVVLPIQQWRAIQETLYLLSIPGMRESIREGMSEPVSECQTQIDL